MYQTISSRMLMGLLISLSMRSPSGVMASILNANWSVPTLCRLWPFGGRRRMETSEEASDFFSGSDTEARADTAPRRERAGAERSERAETAEAAEAESVLAIAGAEGHVRGGVGARSRRAEPRTIG